MPLGYQHIRMYDLNSNNPNPIISYDGVNKNVASVGFHEDGRWMYTGGEDCTARIWDLRWGGGWDRAKPGQGSLPGLPPQDAVRPRWSPSECPAWHQAALREGSDHPVSQGDSSPQSVCPPPHSSGPGTCSASASSR